MTTVFTNGELSRDSSASVARIDFSGHWRNAYRRYELGPDDQIETNGAIVERFSADGQVLEVMGVDELNARGVAVEELNRGRRRFCVMYTTGTVTEGPGEDGTRSLQVEFADDDQGASALYERHELMPGDLIHIDGALAESYGADGRLFEAMTYAELAGRLKIELGASSGSCHLTTGGCGGHGCDQNTCTSTCTLKTSGSLKWCKCG